MLEAVLDAGLPLLPEGAPLSAALEAMGPALQRTAYEPQVSLEIAQAWAAAPHRPRLVGLYGEVGRRKMLAA